MPIAELIRRQRGGAAVVMGALSPRTRNAQVALFHNGDVDYLVATDAIGMGLNLDVDHVAFASDRKFDGWQFRRLKTPPRWRRSRAARAAPPAMAPSAPRGAAAFRCGTCGTSEDHVFETAKVLQWRNAVPDYSSIAALQASLSAVPREEGLTPRAHRR